MKKSLKSACFPYAAFTACFATGVCQPKSGVAKLSPFRVRPQSFFEGHAEDKDVRHLLNFLFVLIIILRIFRLSGNLVKVLRCASNSWQRKMKHDETWNLKRKILKKSYKTTCK